MSGDMWITQGGIVVEEERSGARWVKRGRNLLRVETVEAYRVEGGGFHGWLRRDRLRPWPKGCR